MKALTGLLVALALVESAAAATVATSGVAGRVVTRAVDTRGCLRPPCYKPAPGVSVTFARGSQVVRATSDRGGRFRIPLDPGMWTVRAPGLVSPGHARSVRVSKDRMTTVTLVVARATALR